MTQLNSEDPEVQQFIENVPAFRTKIRKIYEAIHQGDLASLKVVYREMDYISSIDRVLCPNFEHPALTSSFTKIYIFAGEK